MSALRPAGAKLAGSRFSRWSDRPRASGADTEGGTEGKRQMQRRWVVWKRKKNIRPISCAAMLPQEHCKNKEAAMCMNSCDVNWKYKFKERRNRTWQWILNAGAIEKTVVRAYDETDLQTVTQLLAIVALGSGVRACRWKERRSLMVSLFPKRVTSERFKSQHCKGKKCKKVVSIWTRSLSKLDGGEQEGHVAWIAMWRPGEKTHWKHKDVVTLWYNMEIWPH